MTLAVIAIYLISFMRSVLAPAAVALTVGLVVFVSGEGITLSPIGFTALFLVACAVPTAAFAAAALVRRVFECPSQHQLAGIELLAMTLAAYLAIDSRTAFSLFGAAGVIGAHSSPLSIISVVSLVITNVAFVSG